MSYEVADFKRQVIERSQAVPVLVDFWAPWCGPCRTLGPVLERLAAQAGGRWKLIKVNTEEHPDLAEQFNISSIPAVKLFVHGQVADQFVGALPEREIRQFLDKALPSPGAAQVAEARRLIDQGAYPAATAVLEPLVASEPGDQEARVLLAQAVLGSDPDKAVALLAGINPDSEWSTRADAVKVLAGFAKTALHPGSLPESRVREQYLQGADAVRRLDLAAALEAFIAVLERDKEYMNGGAKAAGKAVFQLLGLRHPVTERFHRAFSSALHA